MATTTPWYRWDHDQGSAFAPVPGNGDEGVLLGELFFFAVLQGENDEVLVCDGNLSGSYSLLQPPAKSKASGLSSLETLQRTRRTWLKESAQEAS